jgi:hypothetical protein
MKGGTLLLVRILVDPLFAKLYAMLFGGPFGLVDVAI